jgi:hypothetical protein
MASLRIDCVNKTNRTDPHARIERIGGPKADGTRWRLTEARAIEGIEDATWAFHVEQPAGHVVRVIIATRLDRKYLKTEADGEQPDNLLALPECE